ncbi:carbohydrate kinase family protein [Halomarina halobia]|uniref:Carbohydrate kinase family protein n=1 Tax=Halomarina halobia TaxID=3033386 RepID=A0ABD6A8X2_9EURY|nr:carbohydrate kinase [Halomarina sp. PSR21]
MSTPRVLVAGETLVDLLPERSGPLDRVERFVRRPGGAPANVAVALARLDEVPWFWTRLATDPLGDFLGRTLDAEGIPGRFVERDADARTTLALVTHDEDAVPTFSFYRAEGPDARFEPGTVPDDALDAVDWVVFGGVVLSTGAGWRALLDLVRRARERDCTVVFDPNARPELWDEGEFARAIDEVLPLVDVVKASPDDLELAGFDAGLDPEALARAVCGRGPHTTLLTLGGDGSIAVAAADAPWGPAERAHPGYAVDAVDTTGAGDAFLAGTVAALAEGRSLEEVLGFANAVAARTTTGSGAMTALPDRGAVEAFRDRVGSKTTEERD